MGSKLQEHGGQRGPRVVALGEGQTGEFKEQQKVHECSARVWGVRWEREQGCPIGQAEQNIPSP